MDSNRPCKDTQEEPAWFSQLETPGTPNKYSLLRSNDGELRKPRKHQHLCKIVESLKLSDERRHDVSWHEMWQRYAHRLLLKHTECTRHSGGSHLEGLPIIHTSHELQAILDILRLGIQLPLATCHQGPAM